MFVSPIIFLAIPILVFAIGSTVLYFGNRVRNGDRLGSRRVPEELRSVVPMVRDQRQVGFNSDRMTNEIGS